MVNQEDTSISCLSMEELLGRPLNDIEQKKAPDMLFVKGPMNLPLQSPRVSIVGSRKATAKALSDCSMIARNLTLNGVVIVSGLAEGIDTRAHLTAMEQGEKTIAVLGTPLNKTYPLKNFKLQQEIMRNHLAISQFEIGHITTRKDFVLRNRTMALISDATIIVEASNSSGSLHQGWEALRLGRPLFIWKGVLKKDDIKWPDEMLPYGAVILDNPKDVLESLPTGSPLETFTLLA
jgi:DNA processing protein